MDANDRRKSLDTLKALNQFHREDVGDPEITTRIAPPSHALGANRSHGRRPAVLGADRPSRAM